MKIISINAKETVNAHRVAFNVDAPPAAGVMENIAYGILRIQFENGLLYVSSQPTEPTIGSVVVKNLVQKIADAERVVADKTAKEASRHKIALEELSKDTGLSID